MACLSNATSTSWTARSRRWFWLRESETPSLIFLRLTRRLMNTPSIRLNKLRTLFAGKKTDLVIGHIAKTFKALCDYADFSKSRIPPIKPTAEKEEKAKEHPPKERESSVKTAELRKEIEISALQYHLNIVLPETRDQAVYDAIFRSLRDHLG